MWGKTRLVALVLPRSGPVYAKLPGVNRRLPALFLLTWPLAVGCGKSSGSHTSSNGGSGSPDAAADHSSNPGGGASGGAGALSGLGGSADGSGGRGGTGGAAVSSGGAGVGASAGAVGGIGVTTGEGGDRGAAGGGASVGVGGQTGGPDAGAADGSTAACGRCAAYGTSVQVATVGIAALDSLSGLAVSRVQPDIIFAHNDRDRPVVYALDLQGREHAGITLTNAGRSDSDFEDIAIGPCGTATCVFLGDIGDNNTQRSQYAVVRFLLPTVPTTPGSTARTPAYDRFAFVYEDGSHNAEGLMVAPDGTIYVVTKLAPGSGGRVAATGPSSVYRLPSSMTTTSVATAAKVATLTVPAGSDLAASAAAAHPCGLGFLLRTYDKVYEFTVPAGMGFEASFATTPKVVAMPNESQSEGIDYRADGLGFVTSGEGASVPIMETDCAP